MNKYILGLLMSSCGFHAVAGGAIEPPMASIPAGSFEVESTDGKGKTYTVTMPAFQMAKYELTVAEFGRFVKATGYKTPSNCSHRIGPRWFGQGPEDGRWDNNIYNLSDYHPVVCITPQNAADYAKWLSKQTGKQYRLQSEAQWQYVARTGGYDDYVDPQGKKRHQVCEIANLSDQHARQMSEEIYNAPYNANYAIEDCNDKEVTLATVGLYKADKYGVHDLFGNAQEATADCYGDGKQPLPADGSAVVHEQCEWFVAKGSAWHWEVPEITLRGRLGGDFIGAIEGFRLVLDTQGKSFPAQQGDTHFVKALGKAQQRAKLVHAQIADYPSQPKALALKEVSNAVHLSWSAADDVQPTYKVMRQDLLNNTTEVIAHNVSGSAFTDKAPLKSKARYKVVANYGDREGMFSQTVDTPVALVHKVPVKIQGEAFASGADVAVRASVQEPEGDKIFASLGREEAEYRIAVSRSGEYDLNPRVYHGGGEQSFEVKLNGTVVATFDLEGESGWQTINQTKLKLPKGSHTLAFKGSGRRFAINWLDVQKL